MKMHMGVDDVLELVHSIETTPANVHDLEAAPKLLHGTEERVLGDAGYRGIEKREEHKDRGMNWCIAERPGRRRAIAPGSDEAWVEEFKASMRAKVEHSFFWLKRIFGYNKGRYRGLAKNRNRLCVLTAFADWRKIHARLG